MKTAPTTSTCMWCCWAPPAAYQGLSESLAGRYELMHVTYWGFAEMQQAFDFSLEEFIYFGGYLGATLIHDESRWQLCEKA